MGRASATETTRNRQTTPLRFYTQKEVGGSKTLSYACKIHNSIPLLLGDVSVLNKSTFYVTTSRAESQIHNFYLLFCTSQSIQPSRFPKFSAYSSQFNLIPPKWIQKHSHANQSLNILIFYFPLSIYSFFKYKSRKRELVPLRGS